MNLSCNLEFLIQEKRDISATPNIRRTIADPCFIDFEPVAKRKKHSSTGDLRVQ